MIEDNVEDPQLFSPRFVSRAPVDLATQRYLKGHAGTKLNLTSVFSDLRLSVVKAVEHGDEVIIDWRLRGKWTGALPFAPMLKPNGTPVDFTGTYVYHFVGDKIVSKTGLFDTPTLVKQMVVGGGLRAEECEDAIIKVAQPPEMFGTEGGL
jgi:predicted ester cyclase